MTIERYIMEIKNNKEYFNNQYKEWINTVDENKFRIMKKSIELLNIGKNHKILDVASGNRRIISVINGYSC